MHHNDVANEVLTQAILRYSVERVRMDPPPLDGPRSPAELAAMAGRTITATGLGGLEALRLFTDVLGPACISVDHPRHLSFVPGAPTEAAVLFDLVVGASNVYAGSWLEASGAVYAENEALRWLADLAGLPVEAGGVFVSGGTAGNLSALVAARWRWRQQADGAHDAVRGVVLASAGAHSSVVQAARVMDADVVGLPADPNGRLDGASITAGIAALSDEQRARVFAVVATAGTTNVGVVDDLQAVARAAADLGAWFHVDGAYGGAGLCAPSVRHLFDGIEHADSVIIDPHKWLFAPYDCCALLYRDPTIARRAHAQHAEYLDVLDADHANASGYAAYWNPSDYAHHLSRRARGLPFWFSLAAHGSDAYRDAVEQTLAVTRAGAALVAAADHLELVLEPQLSVVVFRRRGWGPDDYQRWSDAQLAAGNAFVVPSSWHGETVLRWCLVNPRTTVEDLAALIDSMGADDA